MSFLDTIGSWASNVVGFNDVAADWSRAFEKDENVFLQLRQFGQDAGVHMMTQSYLTPVQGLLKVGEGAQAVAGVAGRALTAKSALDNPQWGTELGMDGQQYKDYVLGSIFDLDAKASPGQIADAANDPLAGALFGGLLGANAASGGTEGVNPYLDADREKEYGKGVAVKWDFWDQDLSPGSLTSGYLDTAASTQLDPTNLAGPAFKGYKAVALGEKALVGAKPLKGIQVTGDRFLRDLVDSPKYDATLDFFAETKDAARIAEHDWVKRSVRDPQLFSYLMAKTDDRASVVDTLTVVGKLGDDATVKAAQQRLVSRTVDQSEMAYLTDRIQNGVAEAHWAARNGSDLILDPEIRRIQGEMTTAFLNDESTAIGRAYAASLSKASENPVGSLTVTPKTGVAGKTAVKSAQVKAGNLYGRPTVTYHQPTKAHPVMMFVDFFTKGRPSGVANTHDLDSFKEFSALVQHIDRYTGGSLRTSDEAGAWVNSYMAAQSATDRMNLFRTLEQRGVELLAGQRGIDGETARRIYQHTLDKRSAALQSYEKDGFFSYMNGDSPAIAAGPLVMRQAANDIHIAIDFRQLDKTLSRVEPTGWKSIVDDVWNGAKTADHPQGYTAAGRDKVVAGLDVLNDLFKMNVLLRLGYTMRNLTEAGLSMAASGYLVSSAMSAASPGALKNWALNRRQGFAQVGDRVAVRSGRRESVRSLQDEVQANLAELRALDDRQEFATEYLAGFNMDRASVSPDAFKIMAQLRGEADRDITYHLTTGGLPEVAGDFVATTAKRNVAQRKLDDAFTYRSVEDFGHTPGGSDAPVTRGEKLSALLDDARAQLARGQVLEYRTPAGWAPMAEKTLNNYVARHTRDGVLKPPSGDMRLVIRSRAKGANPEVVAIPSYGKTLDARGGVPGVDVNDRAALAAHARENGYGRVVVDDPEWGDTTLVLRDTADYPGGSGAAPMVKRYLDEVVAEAEETGRVDLMPRSRRQTRAEARRATRESASSPTRGRDRTNGQRSVIPGWTAAQMKVMVDAGLVDTMRGIGNQRAEAAARLAFAEERYAARKAQAAKVYAPKRSRHMGDREAFGTAQGAVFKYRTSSESTQSRLIGSGDNVVAGGPTAMVSTVVAPTDARYFEGWANTLNHHFRDPETKTPDPLVQRLLDGEDPADLVDWLEGSVQGRAHADYLGWGAAVDQRVAELDAAVNMYMPARVRAAFAAGEDITEDMLRQEFGRRRDLPELQARLIPRAAEQRASIVSENLISRSARRMFHVLGALPETTFARHPLYVAAYGRERSRLMDALAAKGQDKLTVDNYNKIEFAAREHARMEVNRTLYTINRRTDAARQMRLIAPFYGAWENSIKRWTGFVVHNPDKVSRIASKAAWAGNNVTVVDENGDIITLDEATSDYEKFKQAKILLPGYDTKRPETATRLSLASFDVVTGGQPGPGLGPMGLLPLYEVAKDRPELEATFSWAFPVGMPKNELDLFMSSAQKRIVSAWTEDQTFVNDMNKIYQAEYLKWQHGDRDTKPKVDEVRGMAKQLYGLRTLAALTLPVATDFNNEVDFYVNQLRTLRDLHRDEPNGSNIADREFLERFPEAFIVLPSLSENRTSSLATVDSVSNMKRYAGLAQDAEALGDLKMFGWVANYGITYSKDNFSQAAYSWQTNNGPAGSDQKYRGRLQTADLESDALEAQGWVEFGKAMDVVESRLRSDGIDPASKQGVQVLSGVRQDFANWAKQNNPTWYRDYADPDRAKYERRADFFTTVLGDKTFMADHGDDPLVRQIGSYLELRNVTARVLQQRDEAGGSASLTAVANRDVYEQFSSYVEQIKGGNIEFASWLTRYFTNDPVVF